jgi:hypothetical protein
MNKPFIVIDTNIWVSFTFWKNPTIISVLQKARRKYDLISSKETFEEIERNLYKPKFERYAKGIDRIAMLRNIADISNFVDVTVTINECRHEKDNKFLALALSGNAQVIVSGDNDLLSMHPWRGIVIVNPLDFLLLP